MLVNQIRQTFLDYFHRNEHFISPSSPLVPHNDPTLMFTAAGMVQFKNYFTGVETPPHTKVTSSQKCVRAGGKHNDLENVGYTARHHTFFEMLGNFSFGDYFKQHAIELAWKCLTKEFGLDKNRLYITVYHYDDEAFNIWKKITGFPDEKIIRINSSDNFWSMGEVGPCGPCSEIFYDQGLSLQGGLPGSADQDGDRYIEIWNLVFMQYEDLAGGKRVNLPKPSIDTGMGLERIASVIQGKTNNYEIDLFKKIIDASKNLSSNNQDLVSHRVIADHLRSGSFLIADGVMPSNEGRGYVLRRILRRAIRHIHHLGYKDTMLDKLVPVLVGEMGDYFTELKRAEALIKSTLKNEEERFRHTIDNGMKLLNTESKHLSSGSTLGGNIAFKLYDTYGFPLDLTRDILKSRGIEVDHKGFEAEMAEQKQRARAAWKGSGEKATDELWFNIHEKFGSTEFLGYTSNQSEAVVQAIVKDGKLHNEVSNGEAYIVVNQTPFYAESGGQVGDKGYLSESQVIDTKKFAGGVFAHITNVESKIKVGDTVKLRIDEKRRNLIRPNHSATHLLHKALRNTLGESVVQKGSMVAHDRLRFDFSHNSGLDVGTIQNIENQVNTMIMENSDVNTVLSTPQEAIERGAMALFGEKYGDEVRVVNMGNSIELCGGTHVMRTGDIGFFKIVSEEAIASGIRRIEALTGLEALHYVNSKADLLKKATDILKCAESDLVIRIDKLQEDKKRLDKEFSQLRIKSALSNIDDLKKIGDVSFLNKNLKDIPPQDLKSAMELVKAKIPSGVIVLSSIYEGKISLVISVSNELTKLIKAGELINEACKHIDGKGGGKPDYAQAGGTNIKGIENALKAITSMIESSLCK